MKTVKGKTMKAVNKVLEENKSYLTNKIDKVAKNSISEFWKREKRKKCIIDRLLTQ